MRSGVQFPFKLAIVFWTHILCIMKGFDSYFISSIYFNDILVLKNFNKAGTQNLYIETIYLWPPKKHYIYLAFHQIRTRISIVKRFLSNHLAMEYILSLLYSNTMFACVFVCLWPISSGTAGPIWLNFFLLAPSWSRNGLGQKNSGSGIRIFRKSGKTRILGCFLTNLAEMFG